MNTSEEGRKMRTLIDCVNEAHRTHKTKFKPKAVKVPVYSVSGAFSEYDEVYEYSEQVLGLVISEEIEHANYRFGYINDHKVLVVFYVGRADNGLLQRMRQHWSDFTNGIEFDKYRDKKICFSFVEKNSEKETFNCECVEYHRFDDGQHGEGAFLNKNHPAIPGGSNEHCPICGEPNN